MRLYLVPCLIALCLLSGPLYAQTEIHLQPLTYPAIMERMKQEKKPAMIYFTGTGCSLCKLMEQKVFPIPEVANFYNTNFINVLSFDDWNKPDSATKQLRRRYGIVSNPTFIFIDSSGALIHKSGYREKGADFLLVAQQALTTDENYKAWLNEIHAGVIDSTLLLKYLSVEQHPSLYQESDYVCHAQAALDHYFASTPTEQYTLPANWRIISGYVANPYSQVFQYLLQEQKRFNDAYSTEAVNKVIYEVLKWAYSGSMSSPAYKQAEQYVQQLEHPMAKLLLTIRSLDAQLSKAGGMPSILKEKNRKATFLNACDQAVEQYPTIVPLNLIALISEELVRHAPADQSIMQMVKKWMGSLIQVSQEADHDHYQTYAQACFLTGEKEKAISLQEKAIQLANADELGEDDLKKFRENLNRFKKG